MHLISYDIQHDRLRLKAAKALIRFGLYRVQYSVFMGTLDLGAQKDLQKELDAISQLPQWTPSDSILILPLHQYSLNHQITLGNPPEDWDMIQQNLHTLVL